MTKPDDTIGNLKKIKIITEKGGVLEVENIHSIELYFSHEEDSDEK